MLLIIITMFFVVGRMEAQQTIDTALNKAPSVALINRISAPYGFQLPSAGLFSVSKKSVMLIPERYNYSQGKLPMFCALEDRIWRRVGLGMQFRLIDKPIGNW